MSKSKSPDLTTRVAHPVDHVSREDVLRLARNIQQDDKVRPSKPKHERDWDPYEDLNIDVRMYSEHAEAVMDAACDLAVSPQAVIRGLIGMYLVGLDKEYRRSPGSFLDD